MRFSPPPRIDGIPHPKELPVLGSLVTFARDPLNRLAEFRDRLGDIFQMQVFDHRVIVVCDPVILETLLVGEWRNLHKDAIYDLFRPLLGRGLVTAEGEFWKRNRRLAAPSFTPKQVAKYAETMRECFRDWVEGAAGERDLFHEMMLVTQRIVLKTLFGDVDVDTSEAGSAIETVLEEFQVEFHGVRRLVPRGLPTPGRARAKRAIARLDALIAEIIQSRRALGLGDDLLSQLIAARDEDGRGLDDQQLRDESITMFAAGHETTATALTYALLLLSTHPEEEQRLAADPTRARAVVQETLRLMPPVWAIGRETQETVQVGPYAVPPGYQILMPVWALHHDPRFFADPMEYRPERWIGDGEPLAAQRPRMAYMPFGGGPRVCIGNHFAMMEAAVALEEIVPALRIEPLGPVPPDLLPGVTLRPRGGVPVRIARRG